MTTTFTELEKFVVCLYYMSTPSFWPKYTKLGRLIGIAIFLYYFNAGCLFAINRKEIEMLKESLQAPKRCIIIQNNSDNLTKCNTFHWWIIFLKYIYSLYNQGK